MAITVQCLESPIQSTDPGWRVNWSHVVQVGHRKLNAFGFQLLIHFLHLLQFWHSAKCVCPCLKGKSKNNVSTEITPKNV